MKVIVCICVHNRIENIEHWVDCWAKCDTGDAQLVIINNCYGDDELSARMKAAVGPHTYIRSDKTGFDIGRFQEACNNTLGLPEWDKMLWCCDDTIPMAKDFVQQFEAIDADVVCMQLSPYVRPHIRTTGFMITREAAQRLVFPVPVVTTKEHCYQFEHRHPTQHFLSQVKAVQVAPNETSPLWDVGYHRRLNRAAEHDALFGAYPRPEELEQKETVTIICPIYNEFPAIISCLIMQTNKNWRLWLIHNGPSDKSGEAYVNAVNDDRISWAETDEYNGNWGHTTRRDYLQKVVSKYVMITNPDNWYAPVFIERCLNEFVKKTKYIGVYSAQMVHNYKNWQVITCRMHRGYIDCGGMILKTEQAKEVGWSNVTDHSADWLYFADLIKAYGVNKFVSTPGCLFIHN